MLKWWCFSKPKGSFDLEEHVIHVPAYKYMLQHWSRFDNVKFKGQRLVPNTKTTKHGVFCQKTCES